MLACVQVRYSFFIRNQWLQKMFVDSSNLYIINAAYNSGSNFSTTFGSGPYGSALGYGGNYGGSLYVNSPYGGYSGSNGGYGSYGGSYGGPFGNYGVGMGGPYNNFGPNGPFGQPASPPGFWMSFLNMVRTCLFF